MAIRNRDLVKTQAVELRRYQEKVGRQAAEIEKLKKNLDTAYKGIRATNGMVDAILGNVAKTYGEAKEDDGEIIGYRCNGIVCDGILDILKGYEVHTYKGTEEEEGRYIICATKKVQDGD